MSMFTADPKDGQPPCERCKSPQFVALIRRGDAYSVWDCKKCGVIVNRRSTPPQ